MKKLLDNCQSALVLYGGILVMLLVLVCAVWFELRTEKSYIVHGAVVSVESDAVVFENPEDGNMWAWASDDAGSWSVGDSVGALMSNNGTAYTVTDDVIVRIWR